MNEQKVNVRQRELEQQQKNMLQLALTYVLSGHGDYSLPIGTDFFLADFRVSSHASDYASKRYFRDFVTLEVFLENGKNFTVSTDKRIQDRMARLYNVHFPDSKTATSEPILESNQQAHP